MEKKRKRCGAVVLAAGAGKRMNSDTKKQFLLIEDKPVIYYSLQVFQESFIDEIALVVSREDIDYCKKEIADKYQFSKIKYITEGGRERYHSVAAGIKCLTDCDYVFIHDGARPMITDEILCRAYEGVGSRGVAPQILRIRRSLLRQPAAGLRNRQRVLRTPETVHGSRALRHGLRLWRRGQSARLFLSRQHHRQLRLRA